MFGLSINISPCLFLWVIVSTSTATVVKSGPLGKCAKNDAEVLILGAGMSGISAAKILSDNHVTDFIILEGEDRIGGRVRNTVLESGIRIELGANWIEGIDPMEPERHPLWSIAERCGGVGGNYTTSSYHLFDEDGRNITNSTSFKNRFAQWNKIIVELDDFSLARQKDCLPDINAREALSLNGWTPQSSMDDLIEWYGFDMNEYAVKPENISLYGNFPDNTYFDFGDPDRTTSYFVTDQKEGFVKVVTCLAKDFLAGEGDDHRLHLNTIVTKINWSNDECVCVTAKEDGALREYCASYAIVTFSLGVLKSNVVEFIPDLPADKRSAIERGGFYLYLKIFLEFEEIFWNGELYVDDFIRIDPIRGRYVQFQKLRNSIPILFGTVTDNIAKMVYDQSKEETTAQIMKVLRSIYGEGIPNPISVTIPDWWVNPLFHGMYSDPPFGYTDEDYAILTRPVGGLYLGGEATNLDYAGFVHGAYYSGIDVAEAILKKKGLVTG